VLRPDYHHSIVNLMASIIAADGGDPTPYQPLPSLPPESLTDTTTILWVIDGLGDSLLTQHSDTTLARYRHDRLTTVFPTTTASAITSFGTGCAPQQHAVTGWFMWLREIGSVVTTLPFLHRSDRHPLERSGMTPADVIGCPAIAQRLRSPCHHISPDFIVDSSYSRTLAAGGRRHGHTGLADMVDAIVEAVGRDRRYIYAYWPTLDHLSHQYGPNHPKVSEHLRYLDSAFSSLLNRLAGRAVTLLVSADHGQIDNPAGHTIDINRYPAIADTLALPLCGEPRAAFCYLRHGYEKQFLDAVERLIGDRCEVVASAKVLSEGLFGLGTPHPQLASRIGDYLLLPYDGWVVRDRLPAEKAFSQLGVHGGLSHDELYVPLIVARP